MATGISDLWRMGENAEHLYTFYLLTLLKNDRHDRIIEAARQIRLYASRGPGPMAGLFTYTHVFESCCNRGDFRAAWRQHRSQEKLYFGKTRDLKKTKWVSADWYQLLMRKGPLLYFLGRYRIGCRVMEAGLNLIYRGNRKPRSHHLLDYICNRQIEPTHWVCVTLSHYYARLNKPLRSWRHWKRFVSGFHPKLFKTAGITREELLVNDARLREFCERLWIAAHRRANSDASRGETETKKMRKPVRKRMDPNQRELNRQLRKYFPELNEMQM
jgi:hypothetical protein